MKKVLVATLIALTMATSANAFSLPKADIGTEKVKLNKCLMEEGQKQLLAGKLTKDTVESAAIEVAATCTTKLALKGNNEATVKLATEVLKKLVK